jgi:hypothetical protein
MTPTATPAPPACYIDNFTTTSLNTPWTLVDPSGDSSASLTAHAGFLRIQTPDGDHDLTPGAANGPRVVRPISSKFDVRIKETSEPVYTYQAAGLIIWFDEANFVWIGRSADSAIAHHYIRDNQGFDPPEVPNISAATAAVGMFLINNWQDNPFSADFDFFRDAAGCATTPTPTPTPERTLQSKIYAPLVKK